MMMPFMLYCRKSAGLSAIFPFVLSSTSCVRRSNQSCGLRSRNSASPLPPSSL